jgi:hypothetical protein
VWQGRALQARAGDLPSPAAEGPQRHRTVDLEHEAFGVSHDALGAALCESWGLSPGAVASVRHHVRVNALHQLPAQAPRRSICVLSALANTLMTDPERLEEVAQAVAPQAMLDQTLVLRGARKVQQQIEDAEARG